MNHRRGILGKCTDLEQNPRDVRAERPLGKRGNPLPSKSTWEDVKMEGKKCLLSKKRESVEDEDEE